MEQRYRRAWSLLWRCCVFMLLGLWMLFWPGMVELFAKTGSLIVLSLLAFTEVVDWLAFLPKKSREGMYKLLIAFLYVGLFVLAWKLPYIFLAFFSMTFGLYMLINAVIKSVQFWLYERDKVRGRFVMLLLVLLSYGFGAFLILRPQLNIQTVIRMSGLYLLAFGITHLGDLFRTLGYEKKSGSRHRGFRVTLPIGIAMLIPYGLIRKVNDLIDDERLFDKTQRRTSSIPDEAGDLETKPDLEVFVHVSPSGYSRFGHVDVWFEGTVYTYGTYNEKTAKLHRAFGDGNLILTSDRDLYLAFCCYNDKKTIYAFGLKLTDEQKARVRKEIDLMLTQVEPFYPDSQLADQGKLSKKPFGSYNDYASHLYLVTGSKFYKFITGKFASYFSLGTNCVMLADTLIGAAGRDIISITGVVTPGTYYDYLNRQFQIKNSSVIARRVYTEQNQQVIIKEFTDRLD